MLSGNIFDLMEDESCEQAKELEAQVEALEKPKEESKNKMKDFIQNLSDKNPDLGITPEFFSYFWHLPTIDEHQHKLSIDYMIEQVLNRCINQLYFIDSVKKIIEENKAEIIGIFYRGDPASLDLKQVSFKLVLPDSETHKRGKVAIKIVFAQGEIELFSIFFKPRDAQIDEIVIQTFRDLNALSKDEKSSDISLPSYKIINKTQGDQCFSLWEFIEGKHPTENSVDDAIKVLSLPEQEKKSLNQQLLRLESVCKFLNISDLHKNNIIFTNLGGGKYQFVPIDLESIQPGNITGLFRKDPEISPFTEAERTLLEKSKERIGEVPVRFVPLRTGELSGGLTRCDNYIKFAGLIRDSIQDRGYSLCVEHTLLEWYVLNDFLNHNVTFLTECKSQMYYWNGDEEALIGKKNSIGK